MKRDVALLRSQIETAMLRCVSWPANCFPVRRYVDVNIDRSTEVFLKRCVFLSCFIFFSSCRGFRHRDSLRVDSADSAVVKSNGGVVGPGGVGPGGAASGAKESAGSLCNVRSRENSIGFEASAAGSSIDLNGELTTETFVSNRRRNREQQKAWKQNQELNPTSTVAATTQTLCFKKHY